MCEKKTSNEILITEFVMKCTRQMHNSPKHRVNFFLMSKQHYIMLYTYQIWRLC